LSGDGFSLWRMPYLLLCVPKEEARKGTHGQL